MNYKVEKMSQRHIKGIAELEQECFSEPWSESGIESELLNETARFFVCLGGDEVLGYIGMHIVCGEGYIANIAVKGSVRRKGIASLLLAAAEKTVREENGEFITLEVRQSNSGAIALYERAGFVRVGVRKNFYTSPTEDGIIMTKNFA